MTERVPPGDIDAEMAVLGAMLLGPTVGIDAAAQVATLGLRPGDYAAPKHQHIAAAIAAVHERGDSIDAIVVADELKRCGLLDAAAGIDYLHHLQNATPTVSNVAKHAAIVAGHARRRRIILLAADLNEGAYSDDPDRITRAVETLTSIPTTTVNGRLPERVDWDRLFTRDDPDTEWLVEDLWPASRQLHVFASRKTGKSLILLWLCACLAAGRDPLTGRAQPRVAMTYIDYEMSEADLLERLEDMGFTPADLELLSYYLLPNLPPLDTDDGGRALMSLLQRDQSVGVVIDTIGRAVVGEENAADTYHAFWHHTGTLLRRAGIALARLDHEGHESGRSRGSSAKADDVDIVWSLERTDPGLRFTKKYARVTWVADTIDVAKLEDPLKFRRTTDSWPIGTADKAAELDAIGAPLDISKREAQRLLRNAGRPAGRDSVLLKALAFRRQHAFQGTLL